MKYLFAILAVVISLAILAASVYTMINKVEGWGWLMFIFFCSLQGTYQVIAIALMKNNP